MIVAFALVGTVFVLGVLLGGQLRERERAGCDRRAALARRRREELRRRGF